ncbi:MAG: glycoside hydrolase family 9 protein [Bacteroidota bacterium]
MSRNLKLLPLLLLVISCQTEKDTDIESSQEYIRLNQIGYYPMSNKRFVLTATTESKEFSVVNAQSGNVVFEGQLSGATDWALSGEAVRVGDFSTVQTTGTYHIVVPGVGSSHPFSIGAKVLQAPFLGSIKGLYYQRIGQPLEEEYAGVYARPLGHPDLEVPFHPSVNREGTINAPGGWYDAGDFGKYVINGAYPLAQMATLLEHYSDLVADGDLNIPESGNGRSDLMDELKYEMDWLLTMQDEDGGLFHKMTSEVFEGMIMPHAAAKQRYIFAKGTAATLDFAGAAAKFARIVASVDAAYADQCLSAARRAWNWALENPNVPFTNPEGVITGQYGDNNFSQEFYWAAAELFISTRESAYLNHLTSIEVDFAFAPGGSWANHLHYLGLFALLDHRDQLSEALATKLRNQLLSSARQLVAKASGNAYFQPLSDFHWGSNSDVMNAAYIVAQAYRIDRQPAFLGFVQDCVNYIFGCNAVGFSFLTGFGDRTPQFIHHRQSAADGIAEPVPGLLSGGPNNYQQDKDEVDYPEVTYPMTSWVDQQPSYASNEICLNWNAPLTYVLGFLEMESK